MDALAALGNDPYVQFWLIVVLTLGIYGSLAGLAYSVKELFKGRNA